MTLVSHNNPHGPDGPNVLQEAGTGTTSLGGDPEGPEHPGAGSHSQMLWSSHEIFRGKITGASWGCQPLVSAIWENDPQR